MLYTDLTKKAMQIAFDSHKEQLDKGGMPYIYHPIHLAEQMDDEHSICAALLHDVVEDTDMTFEMLSGYDFPAEVIGALKLLTHNKDIPYLDYVRKIKNDEIAKKVKLADLTHNSDLSRLSVVDEKTQDRVKKYRKAIELLQSE